MNLGIELNPSKSALQSTFIRTEREARDTTDVYLLLQNELARILFPNVFQERNLHQFPTLLCHFCTISSLLQELK